MAVNFHAGNSHIVAARLLAETRQKEAVKSTSDGMYQASDADNPNDATPAALQQKLVDMADDMASVATQFRNRREFEKKAGASVENIEQVLDEDVVSKALKLVEVANTENLSLDSFLAQARSLFPDESDLYLVLKELLKRKQLSQIQRRKLNALLEDVVRNAEPKALKGGINCALKARLFGATLGMKSSFLRQTYRRFLESDLAPIEEYEEWIAMYGFRWRHVVSDFIEESLGTDIRAEDPSCSLLEFGNLLTHMRKVNLLRTADREFVISLLNKNLVPLHTQKIQGENNEEALWLTLFFGLVQQEMHPVKFLQQMIDECCLQTAEEKSIWLYAVRTAYKRLPMALLEVLDDKESGTEMVEKIASISAFDRLIDENYVVEMREQRRSLS